MLAGTDTDLQGTWIAVDRSTDVVMADAVELDHLHQLIADRHLTNIVIQRVPRPNDPMFIGMV